MRFVDREIELRWLDERWGARDPQLLIVYGKRRVSERWPGRKARFSSSAISRSRSVS